MPFDVARRTRRSPGLTPLVDVVFLLLVFFMLATRLGAENTTPLRVESHSADRSTSEEDAIRIRLEGDGGVWLADALVNELALSKTLASALRAAPAAAVVVDPAGELPVQRIVDILELASDAGATSVVLRDRDGARAGDVSRGAEGASADGWGG